MTTEEKANEICKRHIFDSNHYDCCMEMAEWKEQQIIEKACEWLNSVTHYFFDSSLEAECFVKNFMKAMEE